MTEGIQAVLAKVKKLLKLAEGKANADESASAAAKAQELIDKYKLTVSDLEAEALAAEPVVDQGTLKVSKQLIIWMAALASAIAEANSCRAFVVENGHPLSFHLRLLGSQSDSDITKYLFTYLVREINRLVKLAVVRVDPADVRAYSKAFRLGCVDAIRSRLKIQKAQLRLEHSKTALMRIDNQLAKVDKELKDLGAQPRSADAKVQLDGYAAGVKEGEKIPLNKGLGGGNASRAIDEGRKLLG